LNGINKSTVEFLLFLQEVKIEGYERLSEHI